MQAVLIFELPEESNSCEIAHKAMQYALAWDEIKNEIRRLVKYEGSLTEETEKYLQEIRDMMNNLEIEYNLPLPE